MKNLLKVILVIGIIAGIIAGTTVLIRKYYPSSTPLVTQTTGGEGSNGTTTDSGSTGDDPYTEEITEINPEVTDIVF